MKIRFLFVIAAAIHLGSCAGSPASTPISSGVRKIANVDPVEAGKVGFGTKNIMASSVTKQEATVIFEPKTNLSILAFKFESTRTRLILTEEARTMFIKAVAKYREDFDGRTLNLRAKNTNSVYGSVNAQVEWGGMANTGNAKPKIKYGYLFVNRKAPYCTITVPSSQNLGEQLDSIESDDNSPMMILYFTKNQATELAEMLLQDNLEGLLVERGIRDYSEEADVYQE